MLKERSNTMAKLTKKQEGQFEALTRLFHEMISARHKNRRDSYEDVIEKIRETVKEEDDDKEK